MAVTPAYPDSGRDEAVCTEIACMGDPCALDECGPRPGVPNRICECSFRLVLVPAFATMRVDVAGERLICPKTGAYAGRRIRTGWLTFARVQRGLRRRCALKLAACR